MPKIKKTGITPPAPPAEEEYEFSRLTEKDSSMADQLTAACWWEYLRESNRVLFAVAEYRSGAVLLSDAVEPIRDIVGINMLMEIALCCPHFPSRPWLCIPRNERSIALDILNRFLCPAAWIVADKYRASKSEIGAQNVIRLPVLGGSRRARGTGRRSILLTVNWEANDEQILEVMGAWLTSHRQITTHPENKRRPRLTGGNLKFPAQYREALGWLTPHRLFAALGTWEAVGDELAPAMKIGRTMVSQSNPEAAKEQAKKARRIIKWLDGTR